MPDNIHDRQAASPAPSPAATGGAAGITIRPLTSIEEYEACAALESEVWGPGFHNPTPISMLIVLTHIGGLVAGAFDSAGALLGFVLSLVGAWHGEVMHWSHLLAVRDSARNRGIGRLLKEFQLAELARRGIAHVYWSFDPLVAKNAHLNLERLGARVVEYVPNLYGVTKSPLHYGLPTDRFVVACPTGGMAGAAGAAGAAGVLGTTGADRVIGRSAGHSAGHSAAELASPATDYPVLTPFPQPGDVPPPEDRARMPVALVEVPVDIQTVLAHEPEVAAVWRATTREHFTWALAHGYEVVGIHGGAPSASSASSAPSSSTPPRAFYVLRARPGGIPSDGALS